MKLSLKKLLKQRLRLRGVRGAITSIISETLFDVVEGLFIKYTTEYSNEEFQEKVDEGYNLVKDLIENHREELAQALVIFDKVKRFIVWDRSLIVAIIVEALVNRGWKLRREDVEWIRRQVLLFEKLFIR